MAKRTKKDLGTRTSIGAQVDAYTDIDPVQPAIQPRAGASARIIAIPLSDILPDPTQARVVLPPELYREFYFPGGDGPGIDCFRVAGILLESARHDPGLRFQVDRLLELGESIRQHGQIEPATGYREPRAGGGEFIRLLVGERRFWSLAIRAARDGLHQEPTLDVILKERYNLGEQLAENLQRDDLTAVDLARGIAALILNALGQPPDPADSDYTERLREALRVRKLPAGVWEAVQQHVPRSRPYLSRLLNILRLPDELLYVAAVNKLPEKTLRPILSAPQRDWEALVHAAVQENYTAEEMREAVEAARKPVKNKKTRSGRLSVHQRTASRILSIVKLTNQRDFEENYREVAELVSTGYEDPNDVTEVGRRLIQLGQALQDTAERRKA